MGSRQPFADMTSMRLGLGTSGGPEKLSEAGRATQSDCSSQTPA